MVLLLRESFKVTLPVHLTIDEIPSSIDFHECPIFIENAYVMPKGKSKDTSASSQHSINEDGLHLFILIHGLEASYAEMIDLMNEIVLVNDNAGFILPHSINKEKSRDKIETLGLKVAEEIRASIKEDFDNDEIGKISFICHSLGGLIAREAMSHLLEYKHLFHTYMSLASPHLGITEASTHIKLGLWFSEIFVTYD